MPGGCALTLEASGARGPQDSIQVTLVITTQELIHALRCQCTDTDRAVSQRQHAIETVAGWEHKLSTSGREAASAVIADHTYICCAGTDLTFIVPNSSLFQEAIEL